MDSIIAQGQGERGETCGSDDCHFSPGSYPATPPKSPSGQYIESPAKERVVSVEKAVTD